MTLKSLSSAGAIMRRIATRTPQLHPRPADFVCTRSTCDVAWSGDEADCWNCGMPATHRTSRGSALQRLLLSVDPHTAPRRKDVPA